MDDRSTRKALDAIADLLLTGPVEHPVDAPVPGITGAPATPAAGHLRLHRDPDFDGEPEAEPVARSRGAMAVIETVLLGNLPGFAAPWISQYAQHAAATGPVALLRVDGGQLELEIFSDPATRWRSPVPPGPGGSVASLAGVVQKLGPEVGLWLVVAGCGSGDDLSDRPPLRQFQRWTLLSGADDAATVGACRLLKTQIEAAGVRPRVGLMFMGCDEPAGRLALDRIGRAAAAFLDTPLQLRGVMPRMGPVHRVYLGRFQTADHQPIWPQLEPMLGSALSALPHDNPEPEIQIPAPPTAPRSPRPPNVGFRPPTADLAPHSTPANPVNPFAAGFQVAHHDDPESLDAPGLDATPLDTPGDPLNLLIESTLRTPAAPLRPDPTPTHTHTPSAPSAPAPATPASTINNNLAAYLTDPALTPLQARCPRQPLVQLALDPTGRIHLLLRAEGDRATAAVTELEQARAWAMEHAALIALTVPGRALHVETPAVLHLFTDAPRRVADLAFAGPPARRPLRLHLLKHLPDHPDPIHEELT